MIYSSFIMIIQKRKERRFAESGKVFIPGLCLLPGFLLDISAGGCRIRFPSSIEIDDASDYKASFALGNKIANVPFILVLQPRWESKQSTGTEIGFEVLHVPETKRLASYIEYRCRRIVSTGTKPVAAAI